MTKTVDSSAATIEAVSATQDEHGRFLVSGKLVFETVPDLMKQARRLFAAVDNAVVDFSAVESCNSAGLAVILEMAREMQWQRKSISFHALPEQIHTFARAYGVDRELSESGLIC